MDRKCEDCRHCLHWEEYGNPMHDCGNKDAFEFIGRLDGDEDPAAAGCPWFESMSVYIKHLEERIRDLDHVGAMLDLRESNLETPEEEAKRRLAVLDKHACGESEETAE